MTQPTLNPEALERAAAVFEAEFNGTYSGEDLVASCIRTYLASLPPVDAEPVASDLAERLRRYPNLLEWGGDRSLIAEAAAAIIALQGEVEAYRDRCARNRWNIDEDGNDLLICRGDHEKGEKCEFERYVPHETVAAVEAEVDRITRDRDMFASRCADYAAEVARLIDERDKAWGEIDTYRNMAARKSSEKAEAVAENARLKAELAEAHRVIEPFAKKADACSHLPDFETNEFFAILRRARSFRDRQKAGECATEGCNSLATVYFERGGVGSRYCQPCYLKIQALPDDWQKTGEKG